ncbi:hypothetical protein OIU79_004236 [Salix purpurea]|uniref:Uncharacterized protein n=1 Tax=Salix purpurea TaxID=77065 RepID=A0A9Q0U9Q1_SALPP|nr:hypothetical protein OIU79_004236 [Salix purpurea]
MQAQAQAQHVANSTNVASAASGFYLQRHCSEQPQPQGPSATSSTGMLSLCHPVTFANTSTTDPAKAAAAASNNMKVQVKPAEQKQPAGE